MRRKYNVTAVSTPEDLRQFEGWELRRAHVGNRPGIILQRSRFGRKGYVGSRKEVLCGKVIKNIEKADFCAFG